MIHTFSKLLDAAFWGPPAAYTKAEKIVAESRQLKLRKFKSYHHQVNAYRKMYWKLSETYDNLMEYGSINELKMKFIMAAKADVYDELLSIEEELAQLQPEGAETRRISEQQQKYLEAEKKHPKQENCSDF